MAIIRAYRIGDVPNRGVKAKSEGHQIVMNRLKSTTVKLVTFMLLVGVALSANAISEKNRAAIEERIKPTGAICLEGDTSCGTVAAVASGPQSPEDIYNANCTACHSTGLPGSPQLGDVAAWSARLEKGIDQVYANAIGGIAPLMPVKGLCMTCSDDDIKAVVDYMVDNSK